jgi:hypothetical protein
MYGKTGKMGRKKEGQVLLRRRLAIPFYGLKRHEEKGASRRFPVTKITNQALSGALHESARAATIDSWVLQDSGKGKPAALQNATPKGTKPKLWMSRNS